MPAPTPAPPPYANATQAGIVSAQAQSFGGEKTFVAQVHLGPFGLEFDDGSVIATKYDGSRWLGTTPGPIHYDSGNVGINATVPAAPSQRLEVGGNIKISGIYGTNGLIFPDGTTQIHASPWLNNVTHLRYDTLPVGLGIAPTVGVRLEVLGNIGITGVPGATGLRFPDGSTIVTAPVSSQWTTGPLGFIYRNGNVGVGTATAVTGVIFEASGQTLLSNHTRPLTVRSTDNTGFDYGGVFNVGTGGIPRVAFSINDVIFGSVGGNNAESGGLVDGAHLAAASGKSVALTTGNVLALKVDPSGRVKVGGAGGSIVKQFEVAGDASITGDFSVDTNVLFVNTATNRVGVNNSSPTVALDVTGDIKASASVTGLSLVSTNNATISGDLAVDGSTLVVNSATNRVGINTAGPTEALEVTGNIKASGNVSASGTISGSNLSTSGGITVTGTGTFDTIVANIATINSTLTVDGSTLVVNPTTNRVGIGVASPTVALDVLGDIKATASATFGGNLAVDTNVLFVDTAANRVGINNASPLQPLDVIGNIKTSANALVGNLADTAGALRLTLTPSGNNFHYAQVPGGAIGVIHGFANSNTLTNPGAKLLAVFNDNAVTEKFSISQAGNVSITGNASIAGTLSVTGASTLAAVNATNGVFSGDLNVGSNALVVVDSSNRVGINQPTPAEALDVVGNGLFTGTVTAANLSTSGSLTTGAITATTGTFSGNVVVDTNVLFVDTATNRVGINKAPTLAELDVNGGAAISGTLAVTGISTLGTVNASSLSSSGALSVTGTSTLGVVNAGAVTGTALASSGTLNVTGISTLGTVNASALSSSGTLNVTGISTLGTVNAGAVTGTSLASTGTLNVSGISTLSTTNTGVLTASNATVTGSLSVNGATTLGDVSGDNVTFNASTASTPNGLKFDGNTLVIDAANDRVGINKTSPAVTLDVVGDTTISGALSSGSITLSGAAIAGNLTVNGNSTLGNAGSDILTLTGTTVTTPNGLNFDAGTLVIDANNNRVGVGASPGAFTLDVVGTFRSTNNATIGNALTVSSTATFGGNVNLTNPAGNLTVDTNVLFVDATGNRVGINKTPSLADLDVNGSAAISSTLAVTGATTMSGNLTVDTNALVVDTTNNFVGVNTTTPLERLEVSGGNIKLNGTIGVDGYIFPDGTKQLTASTGGGGGSQWVDGAAGLIYYNGGPVSVNNATAIANDGTFQVVNLDTIGPVTNFTRYGTGTTETIRMRKANGTSGAPTAISNGNVISHLATYGYSTSPSPQFSVAPIADIKVTAAENFTNSSQATNVIFNATKTATNTSTERMRLLGDGQITMTTDIPQQHLVGVRSKLHIENDGDAALVHNLQLDGFGANTNPGTLALRSAKGTKSVPTGLQSGDIIGRVVGYGYHSATGYSAAYRAGIELATSEIWSGTNQGADIRFITTASGASQPTNEKMRLSNDGNLLIGTTSGTEKLRVQGTAIVTSDFTVKSNTNLFYNTSTNRLGLGTASPGFTIDTTTAGSIRAGEVRSNNYFSASGSASRLSVITTTNEYGSDLATAATSGTMHNFVNVNGTVANTNVKILSVWQGDGSSPSTERMTMWTTGITSLGTAAFTAGTFDRTKARFHVASNSSEAFPAVMELTSNNTGGTLNHIFLRHMRGSGSSPSATQSGDIVGGIQAVGYAGGTAQPDTAGAAIKMTAAENHTSTNNRGTDIRFSVNANASGSSLEQVRFTNDGQVFAGQGGPSSATGLGSRARLHVENEFGQGNFTLSAQFDGYGTNAFPALGVPTAIYRASRGTRAAPTALLSGDHMARIAVIGRQDGSSFGNASGAIDFTASQGFTSTTHGTEIRFSVTSNTASAALTEAMRIFQTGNLDIGYTTDQGYKLAVNGQGYFNGNIYSTGTVVTDVISTLTGAGVRVSNGDSTPFFVNCDGGDVFKVDNNDAFFTVPVSFPGSPAFQTVAFAAARARMTMGSNTLVAQGTFANFAFTNTEFSSGITATTGADAKFTIQTGRGGLYTLSACILAYAGLSGNHQLAVYVNGTRRDTVFYWNAAGDDSEAVVSFSQQILLVPGDTVQVRDANPDGGGAFGKGTASTPILGLQGGSYMDLVMINPAN